MQAGFELGARFRVLGDPADRFTVADKKRPCRSEVELAGEQGVVADFGMSVER